MVNTAALIALYEATGGATWTKNDGWLNTTLGAQHWHGVGFGTNGFLYLRNNNLRGTLPTEFGKIGSFGSNMAWTLDDNQISGTLPVSLGDLSNGGNAQMFLGANHFSGTLPTEVRSQRSNPGPRQQEATAHI